MKMKTLLMATALLINVATIAQFHSSSSEWHQWRGPDRSGTWYNGPSVDSLTPDQVQHLWRTPIGSGYSGPTVKDGRVYVTDFMKGSERVLCLDAHNGQQIWSFTYPVTYSVGYPTGPRASVLIQDGKAYSWGTMGHLYCLDAGSGEVIWHVNTVESYNSRIPIWGLASNPIVLDEKLIVQVGGLPGACLVAFHKDTGHEIWRALDDEASYSPPVLINQAGRQVLVCWTGESFSGLDPQHGTVLWSLPFTPGGSIMNIANPVYDPPYLFMSGFFDGSYLIRVDQETTSASLVYHRHGQSERNTDALHCCISTPFTEGGYVYGIDSYGEARCLDLLTGDRVWEDLSLVPKERWANVHLVRQGGKVWGFNEIGELLLGRFSPSGYQDLGRVKVIDPVRISPNPRNGVTWAHPAFSGNRIYIRSDAEIISLSIRGD